MIPQNVVNTNKKGEIVGTTFHIFYPDLNTSIFFDKDFMEPIIWGSKSIVMSWVKKLDELLDIPKTSKVKIHSYMFTTEGYRRIDTYYGPIETIGKYIKRL